MKVVERTIQVSDVYDSKNDLMEDKNPLRLLYLDLYETVRNARNPRVGMDATNTICNALIKKYGPTLIGDWIDIQEAKRDMKKGEVDHA